MNKKKKIKPDKITVDQNTENTGGINGKESSSSNGNSETIHAKETMRSESQYGKKTMNEKGPNVTGQSASSGAYDSDHSDASKSRTEAETHEQRQEPESGRSDSNEQKQDLESRIEELSDELARTKDAMLRKAAEFENLKKRIQKEKTVLYEDARADAVSRFLPIREDLQRSIGISGDYEVDQGFLEGLRLVLKNFDSILEQYNVEPIEETGVPFDVDKHDAMLSQPSDDMESNMVLQIMEPGYKIGDRVIKHAKVIVSQ